MSKQLHFPPRHNVLTNFLLFSFCFLLSSILSISSVFAQLSGTYTIGGADADFPSLESAIQTLETEGVSGPVNFKISPHENKYFGQLKITEFPGMSSQNTVVFESATGDSTDIVIWYEDDYVLHVDGAVGVTFRSMTFERNSGDVVFLDAGDTYNGCCITLENSVLKGGDSGTLLTAFSGVTHHNSNDVHTYRNNLFFGGEVGITKARDKHIYQRRPGESIYDRYTTITGNTFTDQKRGIISLYAQDEVTISGNTFFQGNEDVWIYSEDETSAVTFEGNTILPGSLFEPMPGGTFTIGGSDGDFSSFNEAIEMFEFRGSTGPLTFKVRPGTYNEQLHLDKVDSVTFEGESGDSTDVVLQYDGEYVVLIDGVLSQTFRNMTISGTGTAVRINSDNRNTSNILLENNVLKGGGDGAVIYATAEGRTNANNRHTYRNNRIIGEGSGIIKVRDSHEDPRRGGRSADGILDISGNVISARKTGIGLYAQEGVTINNNIIDVEKGTEENLPSGISLSYTYSVEEINNNTITVGGQDATGMRVYSVNMPTNIFNNRIRIPDGGSGMVFESSTEPGWGDRSLVANNIISVRGQNGSSGISIGSRETLEFYFNSVLVYGDDSNSKAFSIPENSNSAGIELLNNIFANKAGGYALYFGTRENDPDYVPLSISDYNALYSNGEWLVHWKGEDVADLDEWKTLTDFGENSVSADPMFKSEEELIPAQPLLDNEGLAMEEVKTDFFGKWRNDPPDIGAVEFHAKPAEPLSGSYTIGGEDSDFPSFGMALEALEINGISGAVNFKVSPGTYKEQIVLGEFEGNSCETPVIFEGESGDSTEVVLEFASSYTKPGIHIMGADGIVFRNMTLPGIHISEGSDCITLANNRIKGDIISSSGADELSNNYHVYRNNFIAGSVITQKGGDFSSGDPYFDEGLQIIGNELRPHSASAIVLVGQTGFLVNDNIIRPETQRYTQSAISLISSWYGKEMRRNEITINSYHGKATGIQTSSGFPARVSENRITLVEGDWESGEHADPVLGGGTGILVSTGPTENGEVLIANNIINISGWDRRGQIENWVGIDVTDVYSADQTIKIIHNTIGSDGYKEGSLYSLRAGTLPENVLHILNNSLGISSIPIEVDDAHAIFVQNPSSVVISDYNRYVGKNNLKDAGHERNSNPANGKGIYVEEVPRDFYGNLRNNPPDIGAIEKEPATEEPEPGTALAGTYTIGGEDPDFENFQNALEVLEERGVSGPVTFMVRPGTYDEQVVLGEFSGNSCETPVIFEGESGDSTEVVLQTRGYAIEIEGADGIAFRNMTIHSINIMEGSNCLTLENNRIIRLFNSVSGPGELANNDHTYRNNFIRATINKKKSGEFNPADPDFDKGLEISGNTIERFAATAIDLNAQRDYIINNNTITIEEERDGDDGIRLTNSWYGKEIRGNTISMESFYGQGYGIRTENGIAERVSENRISIKDARGEKNPYTNEQEIGTGGGTGLLVSAGKTESGTILIANNDIDIYGYDRHSAMGSLIGIHIEETPAAENVFKVYHNSISVFGYKDGFRTSTLTEANAFVAEAVGENNLHILNNIFHKYNDDEGGYALNILDPASVAVSDYNYFKNFKYQNSDDDLRWGDETASSLEEWQALTGMDMHSITSDDIAGAGIKVEEVDIDIEGKLRTDPPTIGAVEFEAETEPEEPSPMPTTGFVIGGGWFQSPAGAISQSPQVEEKAILALRAVQRKEDEHPKGNATLTIPRANFRFVSRQHEWMSVNENTAIIKGTGTLNREEGFSYVISVMDNGSGRDPEDNYRIIIRNSEGEVVYDNQRGANLYAEATMPIGGGNIIVTGEESLQASHLRMGVGEQKSIVTAFKAYPTILEGKELWLEIPAMEGKEKLELSILDMQGRVIAKTTVTTNGKATKESWVLDSQSWSPGVYLLKVQAEGEHFQQKLVK